MDRSRRERNHQNARKKTALTKSKIPTPDSRVVLIKSEFESNCNRCSLSGDLTHMRICESPDARELTGIFILFVPGFSFTSNV